MGEYFDVWKNPIVVEGMYKNWYKKCGWYEKQLKRELLKYEYRGKILDAGCGQGILYDYIKKIRERYTGVDVVPEMLKFFEKRHPEACIGFGDVRDLKFKDNSFSIVVCCNVIRHLPREDCLKALKELYRVAHKVLIVVTPMTKGETRQVGLQDTLYNIKEFRSMISEFRPQYVFGVQTHIYVPHNEFQVMYEIIKR